jgi:hypothetical protein
MPAKECPMSLICYGDLVTSNIDPEKREALERELLATPVTEMCIRNNRRAPTDKRVIVHLWSESPSSLSFLDRYLHGGEMRSTDLRPLEVRIIAFEFRWRTLGSGSQAWNTTGKVTAAAGEFFAAFGIRWDDHDVYTLIIPD